MVDGGSGKGGSGKGGHKVPSTVFGRAGRLLLAGAKIAKDEVQGRIAEAVRDVPEAQALAQKLKQTRELVSTLGQLKGAAMKAGQMLAVELGDLLPPEVTEILRELHDSGSFMPIDQVRYILARELGRDKLSELEDFSPEPVAAASIGQVHRATLRGQPVAVKVQFPGVAKSIDTDLAVLRRIVSVYLSTQGKSIDLAATFDELSAGFKQEADYRIEAANIDLYTKLLVHPDYVIPRVFREFSTERVLTLSFEEGVRLGQWLKSKPEKAAVERFAPLVLELLLLEFFVNGLVQTDPNYGNFLFRPAENRLVLLDFGATKAYPPQLRRDVRDILVAAVARDKERLLKLTFSHALLDRRESDEVVQLYLEMMRLISAMFRKENQPFAYGDDRYLRDVRTAAVRFATAVKFSAPAHQVIFLNRKLGGMFHLLKDAGAEVDLHSYMERMVALEIL